ncbi:MAG: hypothetical protein QM800_06460 [Paludibacter sp.]
MPKPFLPARWLLILLAGLSAAPVTMAAQVAAAGAPATADYLLMVFMKPLPERQQEYFGWYQGVHMDEVLQRPGFVNARIYGAVNEAFLPRNDHPNPVMIKFGIRSGDLAETFRIDSQMSTQARLASPPLDAMATVSYTYEKLGGLAEGAGPRITGKAAPQAYEFISMNSPKPGRETEFHAWYEKHVREVIRTPGLVSAQRYQRSAVQRYSGGQSAAHMVIYSIVTDDLRGLFAELDARHDSYATTDTIAAEGSAILVYRALGPLMRRDVPVAEAR